MFMKLAVRTVLSEPVSGSDVPVLQGINREIPRISAVLAGSRSKFAFDISGLRENSLRAGTGNSKGLIRVFLRAEQGTEAGDQGRPAPELALQLSANPASYA